MIDLRIVFVICFVSICISCILADSLDVLDEECHVLLAIISLIGSGAIVGTIWLIQHVRFV